MYQFLYFVKFLYLFQTNRYSNKFVISLNIEIISRFDKREDEIYYWNFILRDLILFLDIKEKLASVFLEISMQAASELMCLCTRIREITLSKLLAIIYIPVLHVIIIALCNNILHKL